jgi:hypothetical protein
MIARSLQWQEKEKPMTSTNTSYLQLKQLQGEWSGKKRLWLTPGEPVRESPAQARVEFAAGERLISVHYTWSWEGTPQDGLIVARLADDTESVDAFWLDSWHMSDRFMLCRYQATDDATVAVLGKYAGPSGPDWSWRITITTEREGEFQLIMDNITPEGAEMKAVEATFHRPTS